MSGPYKLNGPYKPCATGSNAPITGIEGPGVGFGYNAWYLFPENTFTDPADAEKAARLMNIAFHEGQKERGRAIMGLLT